jgi:hypothetical protein
MVSKAARVAQLVFGQIQYIRNFQEIDQFLKKFIVTKIHPMWSPWACSNQQQSKLARIAVCPLDIFDNGMVKLAFFLLNATFLDDDCRYY